MIYNRELAIKYAYKWWNKRNPNFYDFEKLGGDCTNFVSQCLYFGGIEFDMSNNGWYYKSLFSRAPSWAGVNELYYYGIHNAKSVGIKLSECSINAVEVGDIVQFDIHGERFHHSAIISKITSHSLNGVCITCHSNDAKDKSLSDYRIKQIRFLKVLN